MSDELKVYAYNVLFGDAILVEIPGSPRSQFIMIDAGNAWTGHGGDDDALLAALADVHARTNGHLDLYIMTHEHMDHVQGLRLANDKNRPAFEIDHVWLTASADPEYYDCHEDARRKKTTLEKAFGAFSAFAERMRYAGGPGIVLRINHLAGTKTCVDFLRGCAEHKPHYLYRGARMSGTHSVEGVRFRILAPEEDTSDYYGRVNFPLTASPELRGGAPAGGGRPLPLPGIDGGAFYNLIDGMDNGYAEAAFQIDKAKNNTSLVVEITWRGRRLLFTGDTEEKSWAFMAAKRVLRPVDLLKISHHGSHNGTPPGTILDKIVPLARREKTVAVVSTRADVYPGVPSTTTLNEVRSRVAKLYRASDEDPGKPVVIALSPAT